MTSERRVPTISEAMGVLCKVLPAGSSRLAHSLAVGRTAECVTARLSLAEPSVAVAAAYLHDVGYAEVAAVTGMHQLDGARFLRGLGYVEDLCRLVAHHTFAQVEARNTGFCDVLDTEFPHPDEALADLLEVVTFCDLTISNTGEPTTVDERFASIFARYPPDHVVAITMREVEPLAHDIVARVHARVGAVRP